MDNKNRFETNAYNKKKYYGAVFTFVFLLSTLVLFMTYKFGLRIVSGADQSFY